MVYWSRTLGREHIQCRDTAYIRVRVPAVPLKNLSSACQVGGQAQMTSGTMFREAAVLSS